MDFLRRRNVGSNRHEIHQTQPSTALQGKLSLLKKWPEFTLFLGFQVPIIIPVVVLVISLYLIVAPIIDLPQIEYLYAGMFIVGGLIFYFPFVYYGYQSRMMGTCRQLLKKQCCYFLLQKDSLYSVNCFWKWHRLK